MFAGRSDMPDVVERHVLVLNRHWLAVHVCTVRRAVTLLYQGLARAAGGLSDVPLLYSHPVYEYLQTRYGLNGRSVIWEPDELPEEVQWKGLRELLQEHPARTMLWEAEPLPALAERLTRLGVESRIYAPGANRPEVGDWLTLMNANLRTLETLGNPSR